MYCILMLFNILQSSLIFIFLVSGYDNDLETIKSKQHFGLKRFELKMNVGHNS